MGSVASTAPDKADETPASPPWGFAVEDLFDLPTVYRSDLLDGRVAVVTGGGTGFGQAITVLLARLGAQVMICSRNEDNLARTAAAIRDHLGVTIATRVTNVRVPGQVDALMDDVLGRFGRLDIVVNNAGGQFPKAALDLTKNGWDAVIDLNLNGPWHMMQAAGRRWRDLGAGGSIVNIVANVERGMPQVAHTCAARAGVIYLSKTLAMEWAELGIRVNCLAPGAMASPGLKVYPPEASARFANANPMRRLGDAWDVAEGVIYLAAPSGKVITGELLTVDGGMQLWGNPWPGGVPDWFNIV